MQDADINISIIIVSFNTREITKNCIDSIYSAVWRRPFEIIVVDNNSFDGSAEFIRENYPDIKLIQNDYNALFAIANNQGAKIAKGKYIFLLNSDTIIESDNVERMTEFFDTLPDDVICMGPRIIRPDRSLQNSGHAAIGTYRELLMIRSRLYKILPCKINNLILRGLPSLKQRYVGWVTGCAMLIRKDLFDKVGGLNENIEFYGEEPEFGYRTYRMGYKTAFWPQAEIIHLGGASTRIADSLCNNTDSDTPLRRYYLLAKETFGIKKAIKLAKLEIFLAKLKLIIRPNNVTNINTIKAQKKVINYFLQKQNT